MDILTQLHNLVKAMEDKAASPEMQEFIQNCEEFKKKINSGEIKFHDTRENKPK